jgi:hypothetical protein
LKANSLLKRYFTNPFMVHTGKSGDYYNYTSVTLPFPDVALVRPTITPDVHIFADVAKIIDGTNKIKLTDHNMRYGRDDRHLATSFRSLQPTCLPCLLWNHVTQRLEANPAVHCKSSLQKAFLQTVKRASVGRRFPLAKTAFCCCGFPLPSGLKHLRHEINIRFTFDLHPAFGLFQRRR